MQRQAVKHLLCANYILSEIGLLFVQQKARHCLAFSEIFQTLFGKLPSKSSDCSLSFITNYPDNIWFFFREDPPA